jgi:hypothetical protein
MHGFVKIKVIMRKKWKKVECEKVGKVPVNC